jgi:ArsR family transcriptional regulator, arsenate/arsenite/antimonite-responsive transcriptional repressor
MALTKTNSKNLVALFHALSDETRLAIVQRLGSGEKCVCDLQDLLDAAQSRLSYHLKLLKDAGLIADRRDGRWVHYSLVPGALESLGEFLEDLEIAARECCPTSEGCCE